MHPIEFYFLLLVLAGWNWALLRFSDMIYDMAWKLGEFKIGEFFGSLEG